MPWKAVFVEVFTSQWPNLKALHINDIVLLGGAAHVQYDE